MNETDDFMKQNNVEYLSNITTVYYNEGKLKIKYWVENDHNSSKEEKEYL